MCIPDGSHYAVIIKFYLVSIALRFVLCSFLFHSHHGFFRVFLAEELQRERDNLCVVFGFPFRLDVYQTGQLLLRKAYIRDAISDLSKSQLSSLLSN